MNALPRQPPLAVSVTGPKLLFLVTEDWYFCSHRLPVARAARDAGFAVAVATRVRAHGEAIRAEGFALYPLGWRRRGDGPRGHVRAIAEIARLYRRERPDIVHHVALKPVLFGALATRLAFPSGGAPRRVSAVMGLGSGLGGFAGGWRKTLLGRALKRAAGTGAVIVQNPEDRAALTGLGVKPERIALIRGSGVETPHFSPLPEPEGPTVAVGLVGRMLRSKGVLDAAAAVRRLRADGIAVELLLAGTPDEGSADSLSEAELDTLSREPGVVRLGHVADVRTVWRRAQIAVLPSRYGEGVPKSLLEAAACARPIIAADMPGCREIARHGETGLLVPPGDVAALGAAIAELAGDKARREAMGRAARRLVERDFADAVVADQTLAVYRSILRERDNEP
jgi:glycosyltransferase involved in cell wall biosynthesis